MTDNQGNGVEHRDDPNRLPNQTKYGVCAGCGYRIRDVGEAEYDTDDGRFYHPDCVTPNTKVKRKVKQAAVNCITLSRQNPKMFFTRGFDGVMEQRRKNLKE